MNKKSIFWAQALDNSSPDHIEIGGEKLRSDDLLNRQKAVSLVSQVIKSGACVFSERGVRLTADNQHFVVEVLSVQQDRAGRAAPIICYGDVVMTAETVTEGINKFANQIDRSLQSEHLELVQKSFVILKKKFRVKKIVRMAAIVVAVLMVSIFWIASRT